MPTNADKDDGNKRDEIIEQHQNISSGINNAEHPCREPKTMVEIPPQTETHKKTEEDNSKNEIIYKNQNNITSRNKTKIPNRKHQTKIETSLPAKKNIPKL